MFEPNYEFLSQFEEKYGFSFERMRKARTLRELHQEYTCKVFGIDNTHELFNHYKVTEDHLREIEVPSFILHAKDDDLCPPSFIPKRIFTEKDNLFYAETNHGGHIGWLQGYFPPTLVSSFRQS
jgi:predicted alpha/beta-fold hydrolase